MHHHRTLPRVLVLSALIVSLLLPSAGAQAVAGTDSLADTVPEFQGTVGPDSIFYGLKLSMENLDEAFTADETERMEKMMVHAELRISETRTMLKYREFSSADRAMEAYQEKLNQASGELDRPGVTEENLVPVQKTMFRYHAIIRDLQSSYPDSATLAGILDESTAVQERFSGKTKVKIQWKEGGGNEMVTVRIQEKEKNTPKGPEESLTATPEGTGTGESTTVPSTGNGKEKDKSREPGGSLTETPTAGPSPGETVTAEPSPVPPDQGGTGKDKDKSKEMKGSITETPTASPSPQEAGTAEPTPVPPTGTPTPQDSGKGQGRDKDKDADGSGKGSGDAGEEK